MLDGAGQGRRYVRHRGLQLAKQHSKETAPGTAQN
jgi:hypothetical protein